MLVLSAQEAFAPVESTDDLAQRSIRGGAVSLAGQVAQFAFQIGGTVALARLLTPRDFGLVGMVVVISAFGVLLREAGLSTATVQAQRITRTQASNLFWINTGAGAILGVCLAGLSPAIARFYGQDELTWICVALAGPLVLGGLHTQHWALLRRNMRFGAMTITQIGSYGSYFAAGLAAASEGLGYWSLVIAELASVIVAVVLTFSFCRWMPSWPRPKEGVSGLVRFGSHVLGSSIANYFASNADSVLVGRFLGAVPLGLYSRAFNFVALPVNQMREVIQRVGLPVLCRLVDQPERYQRYLLRIANLVATISLPLGALCVVEGGFFIQLLLGSQWTEAIPVFRTFGAVLIVRPLTGAMELVLLSTGQSRRYLYWYMTASVVYVASFVAGLSWGITGVAAAYAVANYVLLVPTAIYCLSNSPVRATNLLRELAWPFGATVVVTAMVIVVHAVFGSSWLWQGVGVVLYVVAYCCISFARPSIRELLWSFRG